MGVAVVHLQKQLLQRSQQQLRQYTMYRYAFLFLVCFAVWKGLDSACMWRADNDNDPPKCMDWNGTAWNGAGCRDGATDHCPNEGFLDTEHCDNTTIANYNTLVCMVACGPPCVDETGEKQVNFEE